MAKQSDKPGNRLAYHYLKSPNFRAIRADGALGGWTARGYLHVSFYSERAAIPQIVVMESDPKTDQQREIGREGKEGVVREMEVDLFLDEPTVRELVVWLNAKLEWWEDLQKTTRGQKDE